MAKARIPPNAPANAAAEKSILIRHDNSRRLYQLDKQKAAPKDMYNATV
jgi:hypothetical protein